ncbi:UDP-glucose 4-epimerase [hydrothermal vent metagenome]|uniref:UDP-glucose 4-epimerase n=1 Tax=hydrothermal vent metagenome TaxID=652676 RepID=A0A3B0V507_9ZZZZ
MNYPELQDEEFSFLVTGSAGFIGVNIALRLLALGQRVVALDDLSTGKQVNIDKLEAAAQGAGSFRFIKGDIRDRELCMDAAAGVDYIMHQAALGSVPRSINDPVTSTEVNLMGTVNMLAAAKERKVRKFVYASSSSVYGDAPALPKIEGNEGTTLSPYAAGKLCDEIFAANFHRVYGLPVVGLRYFNIFGPMQDTGSAYAAVIPIFVRELLAGRAPTINGDGETSRDFTFVDNAVQANIKAALSGDRASGKSFNIACGRRATLNELYEKIALLLGKDITPVYAAERPGDVRHSLAGIGLARALIGYEPEVDFERGLELSIEWYKDALR